MAKRKVRRRRRLEALGRLSPATPPPTWKCEAEGCVDPPLEAVYLQELGRKAWVCPSHAKLLRIQIERNENVAAGRKALDRQLVERELGLRPTTKEAP